MPNRWWEHLLHNKTALYIRTAFLFKPNVVVTAVRYHLGGATRVRELIAYRRSLDGLASGETTEMTIAPATPPPSTPPNTG